jgi:SAM-dependent methyltransferase
MSERSLEDIYKNRWIDKELRKNDMIWGVLVKHFFQLFISENDTVLDIGCGFCFFLNHLKAKEKVGIDANPMVAQYSTNNITIYCTDDLSLKNIPNNYFDWVFISNFLEHLENGEHVIGLLKRVNELLKYGGGIIILQPNFRLLGAAYFDFIDHKTVLTEKSIEEALSIAGFKINKKIIRFLPYTTKSHIPKYAFLVRLYLLIRPLWLLFGKQSLFIAIKPEKLE